MPYFVCMKQWTILPCLLLGMLHASWGQTDDNIFDRVEQPPIAQSCAHLDDADEQMQCTSTAIAQHIVDNLEYPRKAEKNGASGMVILQFVVDPTGAVTDAKVLKSEDPIFNEPALDALGTLPDLVPGVQRGTKVSVRYVLPIRFALD